jgi:hypothetical protein
MRSALLMGGVHGEAAALMQFRLEKRAEPVQAGFSISRR